jgi:hypothetical protein
VSDIDRRIPNFAILREWKAVATVGVLVAGMIGFSAWVVSGRIVKDQILTGQIKRVSWNSGAKWQYPDVIVTVRVADGRIISVADARFASKECARGNSVKIRFRQMSNGHQMFWLVPRSCRSK